MSVDRSTKVRVVCELAAWWIVDVAIWMGSLAQFSLPEFVIASLCAVPCAALAVQARQLIKASWRFQPRWFLVVLRLPLEIVTGYFRVMWTVIRRSEGEFLTLEMAHATGNTRLAKGKRALSILLVNVSPASYVLNIDPESGRTFVHSISEQSPLLERVVSQ